VGMNHSRKLRRAASIRIDDFVTIIFSTVTAAQRAFYESPR
jgi:hypothetical protein